MKFYDLWSNAHTACEIPKRYLCAMSSIFRFKQFEVDQTDCPMKINTDGVLLAASTLSCAAGHILDIGTGTGVIALMLAQQFSQATVDAVEIDPAAAERARANFGASIFADRLRLHSGSFENMEVTAAYDLIISNPPFYTDSLHNPDQRKKIARHADEAFFDKLLSFVGLHLRDGGVLRLILPPELAEDIVQKAISLALYLEQVIHVQSYAGERDIRHIVSFRKKMKGDLQEDTFVIYEARGVYSLAYKQLLQPYFLAF